MRPKRNPGVVWRLEEGMRELARERASKGEAYEDLGVLTLMDGGTLHQLNLVGAEIWTRINSVNTLEKIAGEVAALFDADPETMEEDVEEFLRDLGEKGWVILETPGEPRGPRWKPS